MDYRLRNATPTERLYVDPISQLNHVVIKGNTAPKKAGSKVVMNASSSVRQQKFVAIPCVGGAPLDPCAVRDQERLTCGINMSGSTSNAAEMKHLLQTTYAIALAHIDDMILGFIPDVASVPVAELGA